jgi:hypothetical protein
MGKAGSCVFGSATWRCSARVQTFISEAFRINDLTRAQFGGEVKIDFEGSLRVGAAFGKWLDGFDAVQNVLNGVIQVWTAGFFQDSRREHFADFGDGDFDFDGRFFVQGCRGRNPGLFVKSFELRSVIEVGNVVRPGRGDNRCPRQTSGKISQSLLEFLLSQLSSSGGRFRRTVFDTRLHCSSMDVLWIDRDDSRTTRKVWRPHRIGRDCGLGWGWGWSRRSKFGLSA